MQFFASESASESQSAEAAKTTDAYSDAGSVGEVEVTKPKPKLPAQRTFMGVVIPEKPSPPADDGTSPNLLNYLSYKNSPVNDEFE